MKIKICGVTNAQTCAMLEAQGVDWVGLWFNLPQGRHNLTDQQLGEVLQGLTRQRESTQPVLVTLTAHPDWLWPVLDRHHLQYVQLHGFQLPGAIARWRHQRSDLTLFKTLHVQAGECLEEKLIPAYLDAGVDAFIVDTFHSRSAIGSTGSRYDLALLERLCNQYPHAKWLCAGGVTSAYLSTLQQTIPTLHGVDIDSAARIHGHIEAQAVAPFITALTSPPDRKAA